EPGTTSTVATCGGATVTVTDAETPSDAAVMTAVPSPSPVTIPLPETLATAGEPDDHATSAPATRLPQAERGTATSWSECPTASWGSSGERSTDATTAGPATDSQGSSPPQASTAAAATARRATSLEADTEPHARGGEVGAGGVGHDEVLPAEVQAEPVAELEEEPAAPADHHVPLVVAAVAAAHQLAGAEAAGEVPRHGSAGEHHVPGFQESEGEGDG